MNMKKAIILFTIVLILAASCQLHINPDMENTKTATMGDGITVRLLPAEPVA